MWQTILLSIIIYAFNSQAAVAQQQGTLTVTIENVHLDKGAIHIALYDDPATFSSNTGIFLGKSIKVKEAENQQWVVNDLAYGTYALAIYYDINNNGKMDRNWLGIPTEPYAFAKKEPSKWREPTFQDVSFQMNAQEVKLNVSLAFWKDR